MMKDLSLFKNKIKLLLTDIDDTLTDQGQLHAYAYKALWDLKSAGIDVVPVTGRAAGWCEMIARVWPVKGIIGENGGFYFKYEQNKMHRFYYFDQESQNKNRLKLEQIKKEILKAVPGCDLASDQFCRLMDLAIDFCEDVNPLPETEVEKIVQIFLKHGAQAKISSIHVNGWFGDYDKLSTALTFLKKEVGMTAADIKNDCAFCGDSPNDEPMFAYFPQSFAVANIKKFEKQLSHKPQYVAKKSGGKGFVEITEKILSNSLGPEQI